MAVRRLVPEPFHVESRLLGRSLASPGRRVLAFAIDEALLIVPTLVVAIAAAALSLYLNDRESFEALRHIARLGDPDAAAANQEARGLARLLVHLEAPGVPPAMAVAVEEGDLDRAAALLRERNLQITIKFAEGVETAPLPNTIVLSIDTLIPGPVRALALLGVPALYFAGFARSRRQATPGKRLLRIYVERLDGERLSWLEGLERFVGYVHIPATLFVSLLDLWRDPNRRLPHDRTVHTAVLTGRPDPLVQRPHQPVAAGPSGEAPKTASA
jgi:uncharacterized RDD family membrane protein YckC